MITRKDGSAENLWGKNKVRDLNKVAGLVVVLDHAHPHTNYRLSLYFRNAFNCFECCELFAVTTHKPKVERQVAVTNRISTFYNQQTRSSIRWRPRA